MIRASAFSNGMVVQTRKWLTEHFRPNTSLHPFENGTSRVVSFIEELFPRWYQDKCSHCGIMRKSALPRPITDALVLLTALWQIPIRAATCPWDNPSICALSSDESSLHCIFFRDLWNNDELLTIFYIFRSELTSLSNPLSNGNSVFKAKPMSISNSQVIDSKLNCHKLNVSKFFGGRCTLKPVINGHSSLKKKREALM